MKVIPYSIFLLSIFILNGCTSTTSCKNSFGQNKPHTDIISSLPVAKYIDEMAGSLYPRLGGGNIIITDFVNTTTYQATPAGIIMAEMLRTSISNKTNARIIQADFRKSFKLTPQGIISLTRDIKNSLKPNVYVPIALVGSYNIINGSMYIFIKRINIRNASVIHSVSRKISFSCFGEYIIDTTSSGGIQKNNTFTPR
ncbi:hypothetical protein MNB_ARC-1_524 [hydrothermal vent metagenome]|uniref:FlgO domain-containing protein n=1 Tax=hydrothermal vent metagenome TaxID=652676 RepID=A0A3B1E0Q1_9ZZZZ